MPLQNLSQWGSAGAFLCKDGGKPLKNTKRVWMEGGAARPSLNAAAPSVHLVRILRNPL